jgi:hypothetical protein
MTTLTECHKIRVLNDNFRSMFIGGTVVMTHGVSELPIDVKAEALLLVRNFKDFTADNDPHGEHDFGSFEVAGDTFFWKIDYYDLDCQYGSEDPSDPEKTTRVLTIMLAEEY